MTFKTKTISYDNRVHLFWVLAFVFCACLIVYVWAVRATISNTIARSNLESQTANLATAVGEMEYTYIGMENNVSLQLAYDKGFKNVVQPLYISRSASRSLSMNVSTNSATLNR